MIKKYKDIKIPLEEMRIKGHPRGENVGFECLDRLFSLKQGTFTFILAAPHHGKSEFALELIINQAIEFGKKTLLYSPETGSVEEIYAELIHKMSNRPFYKSIAGHCEDKDYYKAISFIDAHFSVVDSDEKSYTFKELTDLVTDEQIILSDPWNELKHDMSGYVGRQDLYIEDFMGEVRRYCKRNKKHFIQTLHPGYQSQIEEKVDGKKMMYYPMPKAREASGGQALLRKAMTWINLWRPPVGLMNEMGMPYEDNEVLIQVEKAKPKGAATRGITQLYFDWNKSRYYESHVGKKLYAFEHSKKVELPESKQDVLQPNTMF